MTDTVSVTVTDIDVSILEDMLESRGCMPWELECSKEATWIGIKKCCGLELPLCEEHKLLCEEAVNAVVEYMDVYMCFVCNQSHGSNYMDFVRIKS